MPMILKSRILDAQSKCKSAAQCARYLNVSFPTYKKWAKFHGIYENVLNRAGKGMSKNTQQHTIEKYVNGEKDHQNPKRYLKLLIKYGYKKDECEHCGYDKQRIDGKKPLLINFKDDNKYNSELSNIQILCYSCYYVVAGTEIINRKTRRYHTTDYFSKYEEEDYSKFKDFDYDDINWEEAKRNMSREEAEKDVDDLYDKLNK